MLISKVALLSNDKKNKNAITKVGFKVEGGKKIRISKKTKWWKSNEEVEFETVSGSNYKIIKGVLIIFIIGVLIMGVGIVIYATPSVKNNVKAYQGLLYAGGTLCAVSFIYMIISIIINVNQRKNELKKQAGTNTFDDRLRKTNEEFKKQQKLINKDNLAMEEKRKIEEMKKKANQRLKDQMSLPVEPKVKDDK